MSVCRLVLREIVHRKLPFVSSVIAAAAAVAVFVAAATMSSAAERETARLMRNLGFNVLILPASEDLARFWTRGYAVAQMPEDYVYRLAKARGLLVQHLVARLQQEIEWRGQAVLLTGLSPEVPLEHGPKKSPMSPTIKPGTALVGHLIARRLNIKPGDVIQLRNRRFTVARCLAEVGGLDDLRIYLDLHDAQELLGLKGRVNEIEALGCICFGKQDINLIRAGIHQVLPDVQVVQLQTLADVRAQTRTMMERYAAVLVPSIMVASALWVFIQALMNVRERRGEIGVLRAFGVSSGRIAGLVLVKALVTGLVGGAVGFAAGTWAALHFGPQIFRLTAKQISTDWPLLGLSLAAASALAVIASYLPALVAVVQDPAEVLREE
ncbi:MAG: FtsX-like permease family protein [Armatimonadetes bacterium]|nr:FtsX-like permease family protein [Armatimonadota bacterium]